MYLMNDNGKRLADTCGLYKLVIGATLFSHKDIYKKTWNSSNKRD